jgi:hypothetical protein
MATPGNIGDLLTTTLRNRTHKLADDVTDNNAILLYLSKRSTGLLPFDGGRVIDQEMDYAENTNATWYSGYETVAINPQETFTMAEFDIKQLMVAVSVSGLEQLQNAGAERSINLVASRVENAERTMKNVVSASMYSNGTGSGGKEIGGLQLLVADTPTNTVGGIDRGTYTFYKNQVGTGVFTAAGIQATMDDLWVKQVRGTDRPKLGLADNVSYSAFMQALTTIQRITDPDLGKAGFTNLMFISMPVVLDGGVGGACPASHMYFLNTDYLFFRPHKDRNMEVVDPDRYSTNQDAVIKLIGWAGNMTMSNGFLQGVLK